VVIAGLEPAIHPGHVLLAKMYFLRRREEDVLLAKKNKVGAPNLGLPESRAFGGSM
jgi:hypothetical protein